MKRISLQFKKAPYRGVFLNCILSGHAPFSGKGFQAFSEIRRLNETMNVAEELALRLLAVEAQDRDSPSEAALHAIEKLRSYLTRFVGSAGFQALLARALALAKRQVSWLVPVRVEPDASLTGLREATRTLHVDEARRGEMALLTQLLGLLVTFIGETVTLQIVRDIWSGAHLDDLNSSAEKVT